MIVDKDAGKLYDIRTGKYVEPKTRDDGGAKKKSGSTKLPQRPEVATKSDKKSKEQGGAGWGDWWAAREKNNGEFLKAVEKGDLKKVKKILDNE